MDYLALGLWFDVENARYTTKVLSYQKEALLWFDVENARYTTEPSPERLTRSCGLM